MTLRHMKIYVTVCDCESVTAAAEKMHLSQPAVSLALKELETFYGVKLFDRISRKLYITESGRLFLRYARRIIDLFEEMEKGIKDWDSFSLLRIGASMTIGTCFIPQYVKQFNGEHPHIKINVTIDNSSVLIQKILSNELDFALIEGVSHSDSIVSESFDEDELVLVCGNEHPFAQQTEITLEELAKQTLILREKGSGTRDLFDSTMLTHGVTLSPAWESVNTEAIKSAVIEGLGVSVLPFRLVSGELRDGRLVSVPIAGVAFSRRYYIIYHKDKYLSASALDFIGMCRQTGCVPGSNDPS